MWQSPAIGLVQTGVMSAVLGVSISNVSHTATETVSLLNELGVKYTLDDRLDAIATDNGANFVAAIEELLETGICALCLPHTAVVHQELH